MPGWGPRRGGHAAGLTSRSAGDGPVGSVARAGRRGPEGPHLGAVGAGDGHRSRPTARARPCSGRARCGRAAGGPEAGQRGRGGRRRPHRRAPRRGAGDDVEGPRASTSGWSVQAEQPGAEGAGGASSGPARRSTAYSRRRGAPAPGRGPRGRARRPGRDGGHGAGLRVHRDHAVAAGGPSPRAGGAPRRPRAAVEVRALRPPGGRPQRAVPAQKRPPRGAPRLKAKPVPATLGPIINLQESSVVSSSLQRYPRAERSLPRRHRRHRHRELDLLPPPQHAPGLHRTAGPGDA